MRSFGASCAWLLAGLGAACGDPAAAAPPVDGRLVLELGGPHASLRGALQNAGVEVAPAKRLRPLANPAIVDEPASNASGDGPAADAPPPPRDEPTPRAEPQPPASEPEGFKIVTLAEGQTLIHLARRHLGDGNRFRELLAANGWTEADSRRLRAGQKVKVPLNARSTGR